MLVSPTINSIHGRIRSITGIDPAANTEISETVPARRRWRILLIRLTLVTDVNAANRVVTLKLDDGTTLLFRLSSDTNHTASLTRSYTYTLQPVPQYLIASTFHLPLPPIIITAGFRIITETSNIQAGDNYGAPQFLVEEWIDP